MNKTLFRPRNKYKIVTLMLDMFLILSKPYHLELFIRKTLVILSILGMNLTEETCNFIQNFI